MPGRNSSKKNKGAPAQYTGPREVEIRVIFLRIGDIDTLNEKFFAELLIESKWQEPRLVTEFANTPLVQPEFDNSGCWSEEHELVSNSNRYWNPQIYIENALNDPQQTMYYKIKRVMRGGHPPTSHATPTCPLKTIKEAKSDFCLNASAKINESEVESDSPGTNVNSTAKFDELGSSIQTKYWMFEYRKVKGCFFEKLELNYFPVDTQDLSVIITTFKSNREVILIPNRTKSSVVNNKITLDSHIWYLYYSLTVNPRLLKPG
jgi:hypothetical protein